MTGIRQPPGGRPLRHLTDAELEWFAFDPSGLADFVRRHAPDDYPDLASRLLACRRAAWRCGSYLQLAAQLPPGSVAETAVVWREETDEHEEYGIDLDAAGQPVGVELLHRACTDG